MTHHPAIVLSHRKRKFIEPVVGSMRKKIANLGEIVVVDDSGDHEHHEWLADHGYHMTVSSPDSSAVGYLDAMQTVWKVGRRLAEQTGYVLLWEEDFTVTSPFDVDDMHHVFAEHPALAQLNLQRQPVYRVERRYGYMESHQHRGYRIRAQDTYGIRWVSREKPFTTNPSLVPAEIFDIDWPTRAECDAVDGGAEPAMSLKLESLGYYFGWYGRWNTPQTRHAGTEMKTGKGY